MSYITCRTCGQQIGERAKSRGRSPLYCTVECRRQAEYLERRKGRTFSSLKAEFEAMGEDAVLYQLLTDQDFADEVISLVESYLPPPEGRTAALDDPGVIELLTGPERSFQVVSHDTPLPSSADIDFAEANNDWSLMVDDALAGMAWQFDHGYKPDLREFNR